MSTKVRPASVVVVRPQSGGIAHVARSCAEELRHQGLAVTEVVPNDGGVPARAGFRAVWRNRHAVTAADVVHVELGRLSAAAFWAAFWISLRRGGLVVVAHDVPVVVKSPGAGVMRTGHGLRDVLAHRVAAPLLDRPLRSLLRRRVVHWVVLSQQAAAAAGDAGLSPVSVVRHGADPPVPGPPPSMGHHVLFAGYLGPGKGLEVLAEAWLQVAPLTELPLLVAGEAAPQHHEWLDGVRQAFLPCAPTWMGAVDDDAFQRLVADAAVMVLPYTASNPASGVLVRAVVQGRAVVASEVPAVTAEVIDGRSALVVPPGDAAALAAALLRVIDDPALRDRLGHAAREDSGGSHTWSAHVAGLRRAYVNGGA